MTENSKITDQYQRPLRDLRISVTDRCNFRCSYCMPAEIFGADYPFLPVEKLLSFEEITRLVKIFVSLGVQKIRITGGEPLIRKDLPDLVRMIRSVEGIQDIALTTNGTLISKYGHALKEAGLNRVTISLDSLQDDLFAQMNGVGHKVAPILENIEAAASLGFGVKINMVVKKGVNDRDVIPMARYFKEKGHTLRLIEYMDVGNTNGWQLDQVVPSKQIIDQIDAEMPLEAMEPHYYGEVASRYKYKDTGAEIGMISSVTQAFCSTCTRARLSAEGRLYTCLFASKGYDLRTPMREGLSDLNLKEYVRDLWSRRNDRYSDERLSSTKELAKNKIEMSHIGG